MNKFELLESKLNIATSLIEELEIEDCDISLPILNSVPVLKEEFSTNEVFSIDSLKTDFILIRQNVMKLIATGQHVLDSASILNPSDMKASTLMALSQLQQTLGNNLKLMVDLYKEISNIEKTRSSVQSKQESTGLTNQGTIVNNNTQVLFSGDTNALLGFLKENQNS